ncbi:MULTISPECIES: metal-dependent hydrolase [Caulobacter]|jgi:predicted metal-dependent hydrolase|uniref:Putative metal-dependent hydrolase n=1 Tax=Caulobacter vibrioides OR37 TaxID=1292034 RepID=R0CUU3_CAUVI|nr:MULTISPECIES: metal-dependent hydrolase [Caulobacter]ENZ80296.1 putative metal-dependent hydrolase [Caulobacter vibrioides OR37]MBQ1563335.1 metal-dependent hydrolase [Caulobacter sp.]
MTQAKTTPTDLDVAPRDIRFDLDAARQGHWLSGDPVGTAVFNALSLTFPDGERLFMDAVKNYRGQLSGKLLEDAKGFIAQEAIHSREHHQLNSLIDRQRYPVAEIEETIRGRVKFARERGPMAMLISTIALEHFTAMMAETHARHSDLFDGAAPGIERLWRWHAMEETEHKAVAYDVFMEVTKDWKPLRRYLVRCRAMALVTLMFTRNITLYAARLLEADGYSRKAALKAVRRFVWGDPGVFRRGWKTYFAWYRPGFHPWDQDDREAFADWKAEFDAAVA